MKCFVKMNILILCCMGMFCDTCEIDIRTAERTMVFYFCGHYGENGGKESENLLFFFLFVE